MIMGIIGSIADQEALDKEDGTLYFKTLPIVSLVIPNPITVGIVAYSPECATFENCDEPYLDYYSGREC